MDPSSQLYKDTKRLGEMIPGLSVSQVWLKGELGSVSEPDVLAGLDAFQSDLEKDRAIGAARAAFFPTISLTGDLGTASSALAGLFKAGSLAWSFLPSITLPIFEAGKLQANLDVATLQKDINVAKYQKAIQTAFREVADGLAARGTYDDQVASLERFTAAQQSSLDLSELRFRSGVDNYLNVLTAQTGLYSAQLTLVQARLARLTNLVDLYQFLGGGWIEHTGDTPSAPEDVASIRRTPRPGIFETGNRERPASVISR